MQIIKTAKHKDRLPDGLADNRVPSDFCKEQLEKGILTEMEHTDDPDLALEIAMDHLTENDRYYDHLEKMEEDMDKGKGMMGKGMMGKGMMGKGMMGKGMMGKGMMGKGKGMMGKGMGMAASTERYYDILKIAKSKYPKSETEPYNPWAVCTESAGREDKGKYERCVKHIKKQNKDKNKKKSYRYFDVIK